MYKNFNLTDEERKEILEQHVSHGYRQPLNEGQINEFFGATWLTKIKIDSPKQLSDEEKHQMTVNFQRSYIGPIAVEFDPGEWYNENGKIEDINAYEDYMDNEVFAKEKEFPSHADFKAGVKKYHRNTEPDAEHEYKYKSYDDYRSRGIYEP
jgi:hypothetical protein